MRVVNYTISIACPQEVGPEVVSRVDRREGRLVVADFYVELLGMRIIRVGWLEVAKRVDALHNFAFSGEGWSDTRPPRWPDPDYPAQIHLDFQARDPDAAEARVLEVGPSSPSSSTIACTRIRSATQSAFVQARTAPTTPCSGALCSTAPTHRSSLTSASSS